MTVKVGFGVGVGSEVMVVMVTWGSGRGFRALRLMRLSTDLRTRIGSWKASSMGAGGEGAMAVAASASGAPAMDRRVRMIGEISALYCLAADI